MFQFLYASRYIGSLVTIHDWALSGYDGNWIGYAGRKSGDGKVVQVTRIVTQSDMNWTISTSYWSPSNVTRSVDVLSSDVFARKYSPAYAEMMS